MNIESTVVKNQEMEQDQMNTTTPDGYRVKLTHNYSKYSGYAQLFKNQQEAENFVFHYKNDDFVATVEPFYENKVSKEEVLSFEEIGELHY